VLDQGRGRKGIFDLREESHFVYRIPLRRNCVIGLIAIL
jgi:hypothetical protein